MSYEQRLKEIKIKELEQRHFQHLANQANGEYIYVNFCVWCNAFNNCKGKNDAKLFAKFLKQENIELTFWQRKHLAEKYFGYKYEYKNDKGEWEITKIKT